MASKKDFELNEYKEALQMYRLEFTIWAQGTAAALAANVTVTGFAINNRMPWLFLIGALITFVILIAFRMFKSFLATVAYRPIMLEEKYGDGIESFVSTMISVFYSPRFLERLKQLSEIEDTKIRMQQLRKVSMSFSRDEVPYITGFLFLIALQIALIPITMNVFGWIWTSP